MNKILWIDVMKGLGILSVVAGHVYIGEISRNIFIFHMPLFFFISGYLFKPTSNYKGYFIKKIIHLIVPYFFFLIPLYVLFNGIPAMDAKEIISYFNPIIIGGRALKGHFGAFWFITCLFVTQQIMNCLINHFQLKKIYFIMISSLGISYLNQYIYPNIWLPWNINVIFASLPIFFIGYIYKNMNLKINDMVLLTSGVFVLIFSYIFPNNVYNMKYTEYGIPLITLISSVILTLNIKFLSVKIINYKLPNWVLSEIGKASMVIMFLHQYIQLLIKSKYTDNNNYRFLFATIISYLIYLVLIKIKFGRAFCLGSKKDFDDIFNSLYKTLKLRKHRKRTI